MTGEGPHPAPDMWGILDKMAASVNIIAITAATWGLRGEGVKGVAGSRVVVFSRVGGWEGDDGAIHGSEAAGEEQPLLSSWLVPSRSRVRVIHSYPELPIALAQASRQCPPAVCGGSQGAFEGPSTSGTAAPAVPTALPDFRGDPGLCLCRPAGSWLSPKSQVCAK